MAVVVALFVLPLPRSDFLVFFHAGADVIHGRNPYPGLQDPALYGGSAFVYPWWTALAFAPFALLPLSAADLCWTVGSIAVVLGACRIAGLRGIGAPLVVLTAATTIRGLQVGSLNAFLLLGCVVAWRYRDRARLAGAALALVIGAKLFLLPLLAWPLLSRRGPLLRAALVGLGALLGLSFVVGPLGPLTYVHLLETLSLHERNQGFSLHRLITETWGAGAATPGSVVIAGLALSWGALERQRHGERSDLLLFSCTLVAALALTPILWSHYLLLLLAPLLLARSRLRWLGLASLTSWAVAPPVLTVSLLRAPFTTHLTLLYLAALAMLAALGVRTRRRAAQTLSPSR